MEASKLEITQRKWRGARRRDILEWLHESSLRNDRFLKDTTLIQLSRQYLAAHPNEGLGETSVRLPISAMIKQNIIVKERSGPGVRRTNFRINYLHPSIPKDMLNSMPKEAKEHISRINDAVNARRANGEDAEIDGANETIVIKPKMEGHNEPRKRMEQEQKTPVETPEAKRKEGHEEEHEEEHEDEPTNDEAKDKKKEILDSDKNAMLAALAAMVGESHQVAEPVEVKQDGKNLQLTININLNGVLQ